VEAALAGDQRAITILSEAGLDLGRGISILIQLLNPELIIIGGSVAEANQYLDYSYSTSPEYPIAWQNPENDLN